MKKLLLIATVLFACSLSYAQIPIVTGTPTNTSALSNGNYQIVNLLSTAKYNVISVTTYNNLGTQYTPNRSTYKNVESYLLAYADTAGVPTHAPTTIGLPQNLWVYNPNNTSIFSIAANKYLSGITTIKLDSTYTFSVVNSPDSTQVDSVVFHIAKKYTYQTRSLVVNGDDAISDNNVSGGDFYLHVAKVVNPPTVPTY